MSTTMTATMAARDGTREQPEQRNTFSKRIGSTLYRVNVSYGAGGETFEDKIIGLVKNELYSDRKNVMMASLQTGRLPERSSL